MYLKGSYKGVYDRLSKGGMFSSIPDEYPEEWKGNYIKIRKLKGGTGFNILHFIIGSYHKWKKKLMI